MASNCVMITSGLNEWLYPQKLEEEATAASFEDANAPKPGSNPPAKEVPLSLRNCCCGVPLLVLVVEYPVVVAVDHPTWAHHHFSQHQNHPDRWVAKVQESP